MVADDDLNVGDRVRKISGDYLFIGVVRAGFYKQSGAVRYVVENDDGVLHIFSRQQLEKVKP
jgi:hypothetical protein